MNTLFNLVGTSDENLKKQLKQLKETNDNLKKENEILLKCYMDTEVQPSKAGKEGMFGKLLSDVKSTLLDLNTKGNGSALEFKTFLNENNLFYSSILEDDIDYLNELNIEDSDWNENKSIIVLKQKILERNYKNLIKNLSVGRALNQIEVAKNQAIHNETKPSLKTQSKPNVEVNTTKQSYSQEKDELLFETPKQVVVASKKQDEFENSNKENQNVLPVKSSTANSKLKNNEKNIIAKALVNSKDNKTESINLLQGMSIYQYFHRPSA